MKLIPKSTVVRCLWVGAILLLIALAGPSLIHRVYRATTPLSDKQAQTERYHRLANSEAFDASLSEAQRMKMREERLSLFYWFHARGWNIDEDDEDRSWLQPWRELFQHWTNHQGANKTDAGNGSKAICRASNVLRSPSPDPNRSTEIVWIAISVFLMLLPFLALIPSIGRQALLLLVVACLAAVPSVVSLVSHTTNHKAEQDGKSNGGQRPF